MVTKPALPRVAAPPTSEEFYYGLLLAIRTHCDTFLTDGARFHEAFECALRAVGSKHTHFAKIVQELYDDSDPMFHVYRGASAMVFWGMNAALLSLEAPNYSMARFSVSVPNAVKELGSMADAGVYRTMAKAFCAALK